MTAGTLIIFAKAPELGRVKTRLIDSLGAQGALDAHCDLVGLTLRNLGSLAGVTSQLWTTQVTQDTQAWASQFELPHFTQTGKGLGERMHNAIAQTVVPDAKKRVILVGTDCPVIDAQYVLRAFAELLVSDVVIGPAVDGGYGLIGMSEPHLGLFTDIAWGSSRVLSQTCDAVRHAGLRVSLLPEIWDVDREEDWLRYLNFVERSTDRGQ